MCFFWTTPYLVVVILSLSSLLLLLLFRRKTRYVGTPQNIYRHVIVSDLESVTGSLPRVSQHPHSPPCMLLGNDLAQFKCFAQGIVLHHKLKCVTITMHSSFFHQIHVLYHVHVDVSATTYMYMCVVHVYVGTYTCTVHAYVHTCTYICACTCTSPTRS